MAIDFRTALTISGVTVQPGYPALAGLTAGQLLRASGANTVAFTALVAADLPATAVTPGSYTLANITVDAQGRITAAAHGSSSALTDGTAGYIPFFTGADTYSSDAALFWDNTNKRLGIGTVSPSVRLHVPWLSGDATATAVFGSSNSSNNQVAVQGTSYSSLGLYGISTTNVGVFGLTTSGTPMVAERSDDATATTPTLLALRHNSSAAGQLWWGLALSIQDGYHPQPECGADHRSVERSSQWHALGLSRVPHGQ